MLWRQWWGRYRIGIRWSHWLKGRDETMSNHSYRVGGPRARSQSLPSHVSASFLSVMKALLVAAAFVSTALANTYVIHHRLFHPSLTAQPYSERGSISIEASTGIFTPARDLAEDLNSFSEKLGSLEVPFDALYQVALQDDQSDAFWDFSAVKACHLNKITADTIVLHLTSDTDFRPFALDYFVSPIPHDGACPLSKSRKRISPASSLKTFAKNIHSVNTTVLLRGTSMPPAYVSVYCLSNVMYFIQNHRPELKAPPSLTPEGEIVKPVQEKNFLQKYWMYIGAVLLVILVSGGAEEEVPKQK
ncbi:hypothetical protein BDN70DRAFT_168047 [Pholiota conissans]|uniref:ER membrane protein complex subunit 10 n=1 Tax=Pholiota conissans TaxID=109636 RepID=A0A9P5YVK7_9AGAR|nr:hypothetical protein BDN70DRAFT_168047 [Pholiota conissans]